MLNYARKALKNIIENSKIYLLAFLFVSGLIIGAVSGNTQTEISQKIAEITTSFVYSRNQNGMTELVINSFLSNGLLLFLNVFLAFQYFLYLLIKFLVQFQYVKFFLNFFLQFYCLVIIFYYLY